MKRAESESLNIRRCRPEEQAGIVSVAVGSATRLFSGSFEWFGNLGVLFMASSEGRRYTAI